MRTSCRWLRSHLITTSSLILFLLISPSVQAQISSGDFLVTVVPATIINVPANQQTIQAAIDVALNDDVIVVAPGIYPERINFMGKAITVRSSGGAAVTTLDGTGISGSVVTFATGEGLDSVLWGFTITGGSANEGGGIFIDTASPTVKDCYISFNSAFDRGGGAYVDGGSPLFTGTDFHANDAGEMGGGMMNFDGALSEIRDGTFTANTANKGAGMRNYLNSHVTVTNCIFDGNQAGEEGGGIGNRKNSNAVITDCIFRNNTAVSGGGGMHNYVGIVETDGDPVVVNCLFDGNSAASGSAMRNNDPHPTITNCTFVNHAADAIVNENNSVPVITNSILWNNGSAFSGPSAPVVTHSTVQGGHVGQGNRSDDPMFVAAGDFHLQPLSTSADSGDNAAPGLTATDLDSNPRIANGTIDRGVYEQVVSCMSAGECDDGNLCSSDTCVGGMCSNAPIECMAGEICELGVCVPAVCDEDGTCETGEDCNNCAGDCPSGQGSDCGNGICEAGDGEDCVSCPGDCNGKQNGNPSKRYCCGDGDGEEPVECSDPRCTVEGAQCTDTPAQPYCCGDLVCGGPESPLTCSLDCGADPCGDNVCDPTTEDVCSCPLDCGAPPTAESVCDDGLDDDCDGPIDCLDSDCDDYPLCVCGERRDPCSSGVDCCSAICKNNGTCR